MSDMAADGVDPRSLLVQRAAVLTITLLPVFGLAAAVRMAWGRGLGSSDVVAFVAMYLFVGLGVTVGLHRFFSHASFRVVAPVRAVLAIAGCMAMQGPVIVWVAVHRRHHAHSDQPGDPHSPHVHGDHDDTVRGLLRGLVHAHLGWMFTGQRFDLERWAKELSRDRVVGAIDRLYVVWALLGLAAPAGIGYAVSGGDPRAALTGMLWGGAVRVLVFNHATYSVNSICHVFGSRDFRSGDHSTNNWLLAIPSMGESWHNNHHAFPGSARHGLAWYQLDISALVIRGLVTLRLASDMHVPSAETIERRRLPNTPAGVSVPATP